MTTMIEETEFESYYNALLKELENDVRWPMYSFLYNTKTSRDIIYKFYKKKISMELHIEFEKAHWERTVIPETQQTKDVVTKRYIVPSVSTAAISPTTRSEFRKKVLSDDNFAGAFVAHQMLVEFFKTSNQMIDTSTENVPMHPVEEKLAEITTFGDDLFPNKILPGSMNYKDVNDLENPQSALAATFIQFAIAHEWKKTRKESNNKYCPIFAVHQFDVRIGDEGNINIGPLIDVSQISVASCSEASSKKTKREPDKEKEKKRATSQQIVDILIWFNHSSLGHSIISAVEYKPDNRGSAIRIAQSDMYATNTMNTYKLPCIAVQIEGGYDWKKWVITATAIVPNDHGILIKDGPTWCKSELFSDVGAKGLCGLAAGLVAAYDFYPTEKNEFGSLLGPVVGHSGEKVFKAFVNAKYRKPNLKLVQKYIDLKAKLYCTSDNKVQLLEMKYKEGNWNKEINVSIFIRILNQLLQLHTDDKLVHGDIRLTNMLPDGVLIDFDLTGKENTERYPPGYQLLHRDGKRHKKIEDQLNSHDGCVEELFLEKIHDCFSMAFVMELFKVCKNQDDSMKECWNKAMQLVRNNDLKAAIACLKPNDFIVSLAEEKVQDIYGIYGTGGTPPPKTKPNLNANLGRI